MKNLRHGSLRMDPNYKYAKLYECCSIINWNIPIQKNMLKNTIFKFLLDL